MKNCLAIRYLALILCFAMVSQIPLEYGDSISIEIDIEKEQEESNEETEKEKTTGHVFDLSEFEGLTAKVKYTARNQESNWTSPAIDLQTPPPEFI